MSRVKNFIWKQAKASRLSVLSVNSLQQKYYRTTKQRALAERYKPRAT